MLQTTAYARTVRPHKKTENMKFFIRIFSSTNIDHGLIGQWEGLFDGEKVIMTFTNNGLLDYEIHSQDKIQIIKMTFRTENGLLVTNQPSHPIEEITKYRIHGSNLELNFNGELSEFRRK